MSATKDPFDELFNEENKPASNWFKFTKVGDRVGGTFLSAVLIQGTGDFKDQYKVTLYNARGISDGQPVQEQELIVPVKSNDYYRGIFMKTKIGDAIGFHFEKELPPATKGYKPTKVITPFIKAVSEEARQAFLEAHPEYAAFGNTNEAF